MIWAIYIYIAVNPNRIHRSKVSQTLTKAKSEINPRAFAKVSPGGMLE